MWQRSYLEKTRAGFGELQGPWDPGAGGSVEPLSFPGLRGRGERVARRAQGAWPHGEELLTGAVAFDGGTRQMQ